MELGMIGLGRMGSHMVRRLLRASHQCIVYDLQPKAVQALAEEGAVGATSMENFVNKLTKPRTVWMMVPAGVVESTLHTLVPLLERGDAIFDGGNSHFHDNILRHANAGKQQQTVDAETTPLRHPEHYQYYLNLADIAEVWGAAVSLRRAYWI